MLGRMKSWFGWTGKDSDQLEQAQSAALGNVPVPTIWLLGKTGSGKSSIVRYLTGATTAEIGNGYRPQTRTSSLYEFPSSEEPIVRFLDTRGLGEAGYDPDADLKSCNAQAHVLVIVVRATDHALEEVVTTLRRIRAERPTLPVVLALTCLHEAYPQEQHPETDPFPASSSPGVDFRLLGLKSDLVRTLFEQQRQFQGLVDRIVPLDITQPVEGFHSPNFGGDRLESALIELLPEACRQVILHLDEWRTELQDLSERKALPTIMTYSSLAAAAAAVPLPWVDIPAVMSLQTRLIYVLADQYDQPMNAAMLSKMAGAMAGRMALRFAVKSPLKLIPFLGQTANAAMAFAYTYSLGKACCWYFGERRQGSVPSVEDLQKVWGEQLQHATNRWRNHRDQAK